MLIRFVVVGKIKSRGLADTVADYVKRISRYARVEEVVLKDTRDVEARLVREIDRAGERARVVALEVDGSTLTSARLAEYIGAREGDGTQAVVFFIGGSYGLPASIAKRAHLVLSLSSMTLPHRLARLFLAEQVYRAFTILRNEPYNH